MEVTPALGFHVTSCDSQLWTGWETSQIQTPQTQLLSWKASHMLDFSHSTSIKSIALLNIPVILPAPGMLIWSDWAARSISAPFLMDAQERTCLTLSCTNLFWDHLQQKWSRIHPRSRTAEESVTFPQQFFKTYSFSWNKTSRSLQTQMLTAQVF